MKLYYSTKEILIGLLSLSLLFGFGFFVWNKQMEEVIQREVKNLPPQSFSSPKPVSSSTESQSGANSWNVLRIERRSSQEGYFESVFLKDKQEIARFKSKGEEIFGLTGEVPEGEVKFINEWENTYGFENYRSAKDMGHISNIIRAIS